MKSTIPRLFLAWFLLQAGLVLATQYALEVGLGLRDLLTQAAQETRESTAFAADIEGCRETLEASGTVLVWPVHARGAGSGVSVGA